LGGTAQRLRAFFTEDYLLGAGAVGEGLRAGKAFDESVKRDILPSLLARRP
jgi:hypothetical protein